jgi:FkbM family methyltransferase
MVWNGVPVRVPDDPTFLASERARVHVVIGIFNREVEIPPVVRLLRELHYGGVTTFLELHDHFAAELGDRFWLTSRLYYNGIELHIRAAYELWADEASRDLYVAIMKFRLLKDYEALPAPDPANQYFPLDLPPWPSPLRFIDCGAFDGDTLRHLSAIKLPVEAVVAFEPDPTNFIKLAQYCQAKGPCRPSAVSLFPCGVGASTSQVRFTSGQGEGSRASLAGDTVIQCVSIDEALPSFRPNLIKMDIEGAEVDALLGARRTISEHRPGLAVCVYHHPAHLWELPLLVRQLTGTTGRFFLRSHAFNGFEVVLYWLPD